MRTMTKKRPTEAEVNYRFVGSATKSIHRSVKQASNDLQDDYRRILRTYTEKGGFASQKEALEYMNGHVQPEGYKALVDRARKLPEPQRTQELTRLSTDAYKFRMSRAKACDIAQGYHARILRDDIRKDLGKAKAETAITASEQALFNAQKAAGTGIGFDLPNVGQIQQIAYGTETEKKIKLFSDNEMKGIREVMDAGILSGRTYDDVAKQCDQYTDKEFYKVRRLVRTEMAQASVDAELAEMEELGVEECEVHCTLDEKTCEICGQYDGKVYKVSDTAHLPTYHPNCRCYVTVVLKKEGKTRSARDLNGKSTKVPASMTYQEWREEHREQLEMKMRKFNEDELSSKNVRNASNKSGLESENLYKPVDMTQWRRMTSSERKTLITDRVQRYAEANKPGAVYKGKADDPSIKNVDDMHGQMTDLLDKGEITNKDVLAVRYYTGSAAKRHINPLFRNPNGFVDKLARSRAVPMVLRRPDVIRSLDKVIAKSENKNSMVLYRGISLQEIGLDLNDPSAIVGHTWSHEAYLSTSLDVKKANLFAGKDGVIMKIEAPPSKGKVALIEQWSSKPKQREALIQRRSKYFIKDVDTSGDKPVVILELVE